MAAQQTSYFLAPNWDYQKKGPLAIGNILSNPADPVFSTLSRFPNPPSTTPFNNAVASPSTTQQLQTPQIYNNPPEPWSTLESHLYTGQLRLFARFAETCSAKLTGERDLCSSRAYRMDSMQTSYFVPDVTYLTQRLQTDSAIKAYISGLRFYQSKALYIITGVKLAKGFRRSDSAFSHTRLEAEGGGGGALAGGSPLSGGGGGSIGVDDRRATTGRSKTDVVFGFQLRRFKVRKGGQASASEAFNKGTFMSLDGGDASDNEEDEEGGFTFELDEHDVTAELDEVDLGNLKAYTD